MGICPDCLLSAGFGNVTDDARQERLRAFEPPRPEEIAGHFPQLEVLELLGRGGMGAVYKARQTELDRTVALKILPPAIGEETGFAERFAREAKALAKLNHPGIVTIYDFGRADGLYYFVMEFVDGLNLRQLLQGERVAPREALAIVPQICDALQFAHDHGIVHRDIKPENILMDRRGRVKVADFGIAKLTGVNEHAGIGSEAGTSALTEAGKVIGTPSYMAPEQSSHPAEVDHRADIYALGVVFYQMLTGELPGKQIEAPSKKVQIDVRLDQIVLRALETKPEMRYQQVSALKTQVETVVNDPTTAASNDSASKSQLPSGEVPSRVTVFTVAVLIAAIWGYFADLRYGDELWFIGRLVLVPMIALGLHAWLTRRSRSKKRLGKGIRSLLLAAAIALLLRTFVLGIYEATSDAVSPEIPRGSRVLVFKLTRWFEPGDVVVYKSGEKNMLGRVSADIYDGDLPTRPGDPIPKRVRDRVAIERRGDHPKDIAASDVIGKVVFNTRFSTRSKAPISGKIRMITAAPFTAHFDGGTVELVGLAPHPATDHVWWEPGGARLSEKFRSGLGNWKNSDRMFEVCFNVHGEFDTARVAEVQFPWNPRVQAGGGVLEARAGKDDVTTSFFVFGTPKDVANVDIKVAVFDGRWEAVIKGLRPSNAQVITDGNETTRSGYAQTGEGESKWAAGISCVEKSDGEVSVTYRYTRHEGWATEMVMVRDDGKVIPLSGESKHVDGFEQGTTSISNDDFARLKEFQLRRNQYQWVEFRHVTLVPGKMTGIGVVDATATAHTASNTGTDAATRKAFREVFGHMMGETKAVPPTPEFEATIESLDRRGSKSRFLDLDTNGIIEAPREFDLGREGGGWTRNQKENWLKENGIDLMVMGKGLQPWRLLTPVDNELKLARVSAEIWRSPKGLSGNELKPERGEALQFISEDVQLIEHQLKGRATHPDHTFLVTTADGTHGLLRVIGHLLAGGGDQIGLKLLFRKLPAHWKRIKVLSLNSRLSAVVLLRPAPHQPWSLVGSWSVN